MERQISVKEQFKLSLPIAFENLINVLVTLIDAIVIATLGVEEMASFGAVSVVIGIMQILPQVTSVCNTVKTANLIGKNNENDRKLCFGNSVMITLMLSPILIIIASIFSPFVPQIFNVKNIAITYLIIRIFGYIQNSLVQVFSSYQRVLGHQKHIMILRSIFVTLNLIFDIIVVNLGYGILGVGVVNIVLDTILSIYLVVMSRKEIIFKYSREYFFGMFQLFRWNTLERIITKIDVFIFNLLLARLGNLAYSVSVFIIQIFDTYEAFTSGFGQGVTINIGISAGENEKENKEVLSKEIKGVAKKSIKIISLILPLLTIGITSALIFVAFRDFESQKLALLLLPLLLLIFFTTASGTFYYSTLRGMQDFKFLATRNLVCSSIKLLLCLMFSFTVCGIYGMWFAFWIYAVLEKYISRFRYNKKFI